MKKQQILALIMAGTLAAGMAPATMAFAESDAQTVTTDDTAAAVESDEAAEPVQDTAAPAEEGDAAAETPAEAPAEDNTADNAATQEPSRIRQILLQQIRAPTAARQTDSKAEMQRLRKPEKLALPHRQRRTAMLLRRLLLARFTSRMQRAIRPSARLCRCNFDGTGQRR